MIHTITWDIWFFVFNVVALVSVPFIIYLMAGYGTFFLYIRYNLDVDVKDKYDVILVWPLVLFKIVMDILETKANQLKLAIANRSFVGRGPAARP